MGTKRGRQRLPPSVRKLFREGEIKAIGRMGGRRRDVFGKRSLLAMRPESD
jgi:hypothetical protein